MKKILFIIASIFFISATFSIPNSASSPEESNQNLNQRQKETLKKLNNKYNNTKIIWDKHIHVPRFISGIFAGGKSGDSESIAHTFFDTYKDLFKIQDHRKELFLKSIEKDNLNITHLKFKQQYQGIDVYGAEMAVHINKNNEVTSVNGRYIPEISVSIKPTITVSDSVRTALKDVLSRVGNIPIYSHKPELIIYNNGIINNEIQKESRLLWRVELDSKKYLEKWVYFIDAGNGEIVYKYDDSKSIKNRMTYSSNEGGDIPGTLLITEEGPGADQDADIVGWIAHINVGTVYDYFYKLFFFDNWGDAQITSVHYGINYEGARWLNFLNPPVLVCGDGDKGNKEWGPACNSLDLVGHEMTHALMQYKNVELQCCGQQGAVEESYSDIFGALIDDVNWTIAEDVYFPDDFDKYFRSLSDPASGAKVLCFDNTYHIQPAHMNDYDHTSCDKYGIHINSGILNKAAYNIASVIGREKTAHLYYNSMHYLTQDTDFIQLSNILLLICYDMFGFDSQDCVAVREGFEKVGL